MVSKQRVQTLKSSFLAASSVLEEGESDTEAAAAAGDD